MPEPLLAAVVQLTSTADVGRNLSTARELVGRAARAGAKLVLLPENFAFIGPEDDKIALGETFPGGGRLLSTLATFARENRVFVVGGGMPERSADPKRVYNACVVVDPEGNLRAVYRKIHLFDVEITGAVTFRESKTVAPGAEPVVADVLGHGMGLSVCYDLRFPELYRALTAAGATMLAIPSAFTLYTGKDHWHVLCRARAIENLAYVLAPAQYGSHNRERQSYGKSCIVDPWGIEIATCSDGEGFAVAEIRPDLVQKVRRELPALAHRRLT